MATAIAKKPTAMAKTSGNTEPRCAKLLTNASIAGPFILPSPTIAMSETETPVPPTQKVRRRAFTGFGLAMVGVLAFALFFLLNFTTVVVSGPSMLPTFKTGRRLLASKAYWLVGNLRHDDIVVIREIDPNAGTGYFIKRVYRLAGEKVDMVNIPRTWKLAQGEYKVPPDCVYVLGDNREVSSDSRELGPIKLSRIIGKVVVVR